MNRSRKGTPHGFDHVARRIARVESDPFARSADAGPADRTRRRGIFRAQQFQLGNPQVSLEDSVIAAQKASISFQAAVQFRNRVVQAYQEVMNMNV
jgi:hypothetical protein